MYLCIGVTVAGLYLVYQERKATDGGHIFFDFDAQRSFWYSGMSE